MALKERKASTIELIDEQSPNTDTHVEEITASRILNIFGWIFPRLLVIIFFVILFLWIYQAEGGIGFNESTVFGWHALLMSLFVVVFTQEAVLSFSAPLIPDQIINKVPRIKRRLFLNSYLLFNL